MIVQRLSIAQIGLALSPATTPSVSGSNEIDDRRSVRRGRWTLSKERVILLFLFPRCSGFGGSFFIGCRQTTRLISLCRMEERGRIIHTLLLLLAHDSSSILLDLLELSSRHGVLRFLIGKQNNNNQQPCPGICRKSQNFLHRSITYRGGRLLLGLGPVSIALVTTGHGGRFCCGLDIGITKENRARTTIGVNRRTVARIG